MIRAALIAVEAKVPVRSTLKAAELASLSDLFRAVPDHRSRIGQYPLFALLGITACAYLADAPRGQKDLAAFAGRLSARQRAALGVRRTEAGEYPAPSQPTFCRMFKRVSEDQIEQVLLAHQEEVRGAPPQGRPCRARRQGARPQRRPQCRHGHDLAEPALSGQCRGGGQDQ